MDETNKLKWLKLSDNSSKASANPGCQLVIGLVLTASLLCAMYLLSQARETALVNLTSVSLPTPFIPLGIAIAKATNTPTSTPTLTPSATATITPIPTSTPTSTNTATHTLTTTPTNTATVTPSQTASSTPTLANEIVIQLTAIYYQPGYMPNQLQPTITMQPGANLEPVVTIGNWSMSVSTAIIAILIVVVFVLVVLFLFSLLGSHATTPLPDNQVTSRISVGDSRRVQPGQRQSRRPVNIGTPFTTFSPPSPSTRHYHTWGDETELELIQPIQAVELPHAEPIQTVIQAVPQVITGYIVEGVGQGVVMSFNGEDIVLPLDENKPLTEVQKQFIVAYYNSMPLGKKNLDNVTRFVYGKGGGGGKAYRQIEAVYQEWLAAQAERQQGDGE